MKELWLKFKDENGEAKQVLVEGEKFLIGRTPDNDLQIPLNNLSRQHVKIERFADVFVISDCGSSNGSTINNEPLEKPIALKNGDLLNLGEVLEIKIQIGSDNEEEEEKGGVSPAPSLDDEKENSATSSATASASANTASASTSNSSGGSGASSLWLYMLAPILMVLVLLGLGGAILIARSGKEPVIAKNDTDFSTPIDPDFPENDKKTPEKETPTVTPTTTPIPNSNGSATPINSAPATPTPQPAEEITPAPKKSDEVEKTKLASATFLRRIAFNDPQIFLLEKHIVVLNEKINQFKGSGALAENIKNARKNTSQLTSMAQSKGLKPQFLANAALARLGNQRGDVVATAQSMLEVLDNLSEVIGNELAYDNLLVIATYEQGAAGENLKMRDKVAGLTKKFPNDSPQTIRTIWFLKEKGELSNSEFDFALQFLAIGTITQNPKDFNVSAEALVF